MSTDSPAIAEIVDLLSKKWVMRILWELRGEPLTFRELQAACDGLSPTVLNNRLKLLQAAKLTEKSTVRGYALSAMGRELMQLYQPLNDWAIAWRDNRMSEQPEQ